MSLKRRLILTRVAFAILAAGAVVWSTSGTRADNSKPAFTGTSLAGWHPLGAADWRIQNGELVGKVRESPGGWLVLDHSYQDVVLKFSFQCEGGCQPGVMVAMQKEGDRTTGSYVSLAQGDLAQYRVTIDSGGQVIDRQASPAGGGRGGNPAQVVAGVDIPATNPPRVREAEWNEFHLYLRTGTLRTLLNGANFVGGLTGSAAGTRGQSTSERQGQVTEMGAGDRLGKLHAGGVYGPIALHLAGKPGAEVRIKNITVQDLTEMVRDEKLSNRFRMQHLNEFHYGDAIAAGDLNNDGYADIVAGPVYYLGPDFKVAREIDEAQPLDPTDYGRVICAYVSDFTGDGWNDVVEISMWPGSPAYLYVNPRGENRRWDRHQVISALHGEEYALEDMDGDGKPEIVYAGDGWVSYAKPDPYDATKPWIVRHVSEQGPWGTLYAHGLGAGDINGDGRKDIISTWGWWEQPSTQSEKPWIYHPVAFGSRGTQGGPGGADIFAYDVNGDGLADVVTSLQAHGWGLAWYEQKRDQSGQISFEQRMIMDTDPSKSHGVAFSQLHALTMADVDGDGLKDIITGKSWWVHWPASNDPDGWGDPVLYWFQLVRKGKQVEFVPHLIHNYSGVGRQIVAMDLNKDGVLDIANETRRGTFVFFGKKGATD